MGGHVPVMAHEMAALAVPEAGLVACDASFGDGGWSRALLAAGAARVVAWDRDPDAIARGAVFADATDRLTLAWGRFSDLARLARDAGLAQVDAVVFDAGVSSRQLDDAERGFSFAQDTAIDMRMESQGPSAWDLLATMDVPTLERVLRDYGEEPRARRIAKAVIAATRRGETKSARGLARVVAQATGYATPSRKNPATRVFLALRILVNDEMGELERGLAVAADMLRPGGRLVVATFHSIEDRVVKRFLRDSQAFEVLTRRPLRPSPEEVSRNPRARSALLRAGARLPQTSLPRALAT